MTGTISKALATRNDAADRDLDASVDYARKLSASDLLPKSYQGKPQNVLLAVEFGRSLGLDPITAINMTHVVQGRPTASAQLVGALVRRAGHRLRVRGDENSATCKITRADDPEFEFTATWTMERAKAAGVLSNSVWKSYPANMLKARAITECARDACPEVLAGISYTAEEIPGAPLEVTAEQTMTPEVAITDDGEVVAAELVDDEPSGGALFSSDTTEATS
jgi:hypothetical protein